MKQKKIKINNILKNYIIYYLNRIDNFYIKFNFYFFYNKVYCLIKYNKIFFYIKEKNFLLLTNNKINNTEYNIFFVIKNFYILAKIFIYNKNYKIIIKNNFLYITNKDFTYKIEIYSIKNINKIEYVLTNLDKKKIILKINNNTFLNILKKVFLNLSSKSILIKEFNIYIEINNNQIIFYSTDFRRYILKTKIINNIYNNNILLKLSRKGLLIYRYIFKNCNKNLKIYLYNDQYVYIKSLNNIFILKIKLIKNKNFLKKLFNVHKYKTKIININKDFINKFLKIYNIINKDSFINIINLRIFQKKIILSYNNNKVFLKEKIYCTGYKLNGNNIKIKVNLFIFLKILLLLNCNYNKTKIYINNNNLFIVNNNKGMVFYALITNIK